MFAYLLLLLGTASAADLELPLADAVSRLHDEAPSLEIVAARVAEARATVRLSTAPLQPILAAQGSYTLNNQEVKLDFANFIGTLTDSLPIPIEVDPADLPAPVTIQPKQQLVGAVSLTVPLFDGRAWTDFAAARQMADVAEAQADQARLQVEAGLVKAAWLAGAAEANVAAVTRAVESARAQEARAERRWKGGLGTELDVLIARTEVIRRDSVRIQAEADLLKAQRAIGALLGTGGTVRVVLPEQSVLPAANPDDHAPDGLPSLQAAEATIRATDRAVDSAWWRHAPTLAGTFSVAGSDVAFPTGLSYAWKVGLQLTWVMYDGGARYALLDQARARRIAATSASDQARLDADRALGDAASALETALSRATLADQATTTAARAVTAAERAFDEGLITGLEVLDAQQRLLEAEMAASATRAAVGAAAADVALALGRPAGGA